jgi:hypothetical protein
MKQLATLAFYARYPGWHTFHKTMTRQIRALVGKGFLEMNEFKQARFTDKTHV